MLFNKKKKKIMCKHENIRWFDKQCMIEGYRQEGVCEDCHKIFLKDISGKIEEK